LFNFDKTAFKIIYLYKAMHKSINILRLIPLFLACLFLALIPSFFGWYLVIMVVSIKAFVVICIIDYIRKTTIRKNFGLILSVGIVALIISLVVMYFVNS
jgi:hypothetical protein